MVKRTDPRRNLLISDALWLGLAQAAAISGMSRQDYIRDKLEKAYETTLQQARIFPMVLTPVTAAQRAAVRGGPLAVQGGTREVTPGMDIVGDPDPEDLNVSKVFPGRVYPPKTDYSAQRGMDLIDDDEEDEAPAPAATPPVDEKAWAQAFADSDDVKPATLEDLDREPVSVKPLRTVATLTNGHEAARAGPITAKEFEVPPTWVARDGVTRAENLRRYGEDEAIEYWPPIKEAHLDVDAPVKLEEDL